MTTAACRLLQVLLLACSPLTAAAADVYAITTFSISRGFNIYTLPTAAAAANTAVPVLDSVGNVSYPLPGGITTQIATTTPDSNVTSYMPWVGGNLRDHTLFAHDGQLFAVCTTGWGTGATGPGNFHIIKRKPNGQWVFHSRVTVPHTLQGDHTMDTSVIWSPIPWHFGEQVVVFLSSTCTSCSHDTKMD